MQIDWTNVSIMVVGFFAIVGFLRGWWKEAVSTAVLIFFLVMVQQPNLAEQVINLVNTGISTVWQLLATFLPLTGEAFQFDPQSASTWFILLLSGLGLGSLVARLLLPGAGRGGFYTANWTGSVLGLLLGGVNGFLILNLLREYLVGLRLPGSETPAATTVRTADFTVAASAQAPSSVAIEAVNLPTTTISDGNIVPWVVIAVAGLIVLAALKNRISVDSSQHGRKVSTKMPYGYQRVDTK